MSKDRLNRFRQQFQATQEPCPSSSCWAFNSMAKCMAQIEQFSRPCFLVCFNDCLLYFNALWMSSGLQSVTSMTCTGSSRQRDFIEELPCPERTPYLISSPQLSCRRGVGIFSSSRSNNNGLGIGRVEGSNQIFPNGRSIAVFPPIEESNHAKERWCVRAHNPHVGCCNKSRKITTTLRQSHNNVSRKRFSARTLTSFWYDSNDFACSPVPWRRNGVASWLNEVRSSAP